jgi:HEAT repeat protein
MRTILSVVAAAALAAASFAPASASTQSVAGTGAALRAPTHPMGRASGHGTLAPAPWAAEDPADSAYRSAREALNAGKYSTSASLFRSIHERYPKSTYAADSYYWEAFSLYKSGGNENLRAAREALTAQSRRYPSAKTGGDASALLARINGQLARAGDAGAAESTIVAANHTAQGGCPDEDDDMRVEALNALLQMDADRAMPTLKKVLARREPCTEVLRRKAVFLVSQKRTPETEDILLASARNDPDEEVRQQAVFWLSQTGSDRAVAALDSILRGSKDEELQKKALFSLSQMDQPRARQSLRDYAERADAPAEVRQQAIFWLGQQASPDNVGFLKGLYGRLKDEELKEKVIFSLSQMRDQGRWLLDLAVNPSESVEMRKKALFWAGQNGAAMSDLAGIYGKTNDREIKEQLIFVYSQRSDKEAVDKLIDIVRNDPDRELRKKALFWLSQSHDPRAAQVLSDIIEKP